MKNTSVYAVNKHITDQEFHNQHLSFIEHFLNKCLTFGLSSKICWRISLCFSSSLSCLLLCASSNCTHIHTRTHPHKDKTTHTHTHTDYKVIYLQMFQVVMYHGSQYKLELYLE